jgi:hypothetical protein
LLSLSLSLSLTTLSACLLFSESFFSFSCASSDLLSVGESRDESVLGPFDEFSDKSSDECIGESSDESSAKSGESMLHMLVYSG